jgi:hypothetical protein
MCHIISNSINFYKQGAGTKENIIEKIKLESQK